MNRHDQELLATQMRTISPPANEGMVGLTIVTAFVIGLALGGALFAYHDEGTLINPQRVAAMSTGAPPPTWQ